MTIKMFHLVLSFLLLLLILVTCISANYRNLLEEKNELISILNERCLAMENYTVLLRDKLQNLQKEYTELSHKYAELLEIYEEAKEKDEELLLNYTVLLLRYHEEAKIGAREILRNLSMLVSNEGLQPFINDTYSFFKNTTVITKTIASLAQVPVTVFPGSYVYLFGSLECNNVMLVQLEVEDESSYEIWIMSLQDFLSFLTGKEYTVITKLNQASQNLIDTRLDKQQLVVAVLFNNGKKNIVVKNFSIYEIIGLTAPEDIRIIYAVNYYVSMNVPYVRDIHDVAKPPLETIVYGGDCEDRAILVASLLLTLGYDPNKVALALVDTDGDKVIDHVSALVQVSTIIVPEEITYHFGRLSLLTTGVNPYRSYCYSLPIMLIPSIFVKGSDGKGYFLVMDPACIFKGTLEKEEKILPGYLSFDNYNIVYAETIESLHS